MWLGAGQDGAEEKSLGPRSAALYRKWKSNEQIDEAIGDISGESCASLRGVFEQPTLREPRE